MAFTVKQAIAENDRLHKVYEEAHQRLVAARSDLDSAKESLLNFQDVYGDLVHSVTRVTGKFEPTKVSLVQKFKKLVTPS